MTEQEVRRYLRQMKEESSERAFKGFYDLTYEIRDDANLSMPAAGAGGRAVWIPAAAGAAFVAAGIFLFWRRKRGKMEENAPF